MSTIEHHELFHPSGPTATMDYLWRRVQVRDLTGPEALALVSALHNQLAGGKVREAGVYSSYSHLLRALELGMPEIHSYILSNWSASRRTRPGVRSQDEYSIADGPPSESSPTDASAAAASDIHDFVRSALQQGSPDSGFEERGEAEEEHVDSAATQAPAKSSAVDSAKQDGEADDPEVDETLEEADDSRNGDELEDATAYEESSAAEGREPTEQEYQDENVSEVQESEAEGAEAPEAYESETDATTQLSESHPQRAAAEESEWPAEQEQEPAEGLEPFEGAENEPPPLD
jgi:hypothetical protein